MSYSFNSFTDFSEDCELVRKIPLSCICSTALGKSRITHVKVDTASKVSHLFPSLLQVDLKHTKNQVVYVSDMGCQMEMKVNLENNSCNSFGYVIKLAEY